MQDDPLVGRTLGPYRIDRKIGEGGMGAVYLAVHVMLEQDRAFKVLPERLLRDNPEYGKRFMREARAAAGIDHPNVVRVYDAGEVGGYHFIAQEFVRGASVSDLAMDRGPLPHADAVEIVLQRLRR